MFHSSRNTCRGVKALMNCCWTAVSLIMWWGSAHGSYHHWLWVVMLIDLMGVAMMMWGRAPYKVIRSSHKRCPRTLNPEHRFSSRGMRASSQLIVVRVGKAVLCFKDVCNCSKCVFVCEEGDHCSVHTQCEWVFAAEKSSGLQDLITLHRAILQIYHMGFLCLALESTQVVEH